MITSMFVLKTGKKYIPYELIIQLESLGYCQSDAIYAAGNYKLAGDILTIFPTSSINPVRINFFGNVVESIDEYDIATQMKSKSVDSVLIDPNMLVFADGSKVKPDDYVVHIDHGIGLFRRIGLKKVGGEFKPYIFIEYLNNNFLYVPIREIARVSPYIGVGKRKPRLNRLGSVAWQNTKKKIFESAIKLARELIEIYAKRELLKRKPYKFDQETEDLVAGTFPFTKTPDQEKALSDIISDLSNDVPMDRLICGDVGYGKTEVAIRAAAQAAANGFQVVFLCPTTILAEQHFANFISRFENSAINIAKLSRFQSEVEQEKVLSGLTTGAIDIVVGTHRLLSNDVKFKALDLVIIDEEQRFGVKQKEKFKRISEKLNVLTLSATPIPRTLFMSLSGIRDISEINTPPNGRKSIDTQIEKFSQEIVDRYIERELGRGGQIYFLHNKVNTIIPTRDKLRREFPTAKIEVAHGQMAEEHLAKTMTNFSTGKIDILVCSTIIENGLDLPRVNTLIVEDAERFGLSQLYQIRGRIGRSALKAYSLFTYKKELSGNAFKRLQSLAENTELGSGFNIAMSDLEIRGGGNILGREQHGNMEAVGLVLYSKLLKQAVDKLKSIEK